MNEFVEECRREWRRLGVPDPVANEMAADLTADLEEAEAEGATAENVLGNSAFDPRRFAASWAIARGVTGQPVLDPVSRHRPVAIALTVVAAVITILAFGLLVAGRSASAAIVSRRIITGPGPIRPFVIPGPMPPGGIFVHGSFVSQRIGVVGIPALALVMLVIGLVGLGLAALYWSPWSARLLHRTARSTGNSRSPMS